MNTASKVSKLNAGQVCFPATYVKLCPATAEHVSATQASLLHIQACSSSCSISVVYYSYYVHIRREYFYLLDYISLLGIPKFGDRKKNKNENQA